MIDIFTDGGALHQGSSKAIAAYGAIFPLFEKYNFTKAIPSYELQTNTRAEMYAFIDAIPIAVSIAENLSHLGPIVINICTDSDFLINVATKWIRQWVSLKWCNVDGAQCLNIDLLRKILQILDDFHIIWNHVRSHQVGVFTTNDDEYWNDKIDRNVSTLLESLDQQPLSV